MSTSEKIDRVVTNRILGLPIFVVIMFCVYYIAVSTLGGTVTDFTNDQLFGTDGWYVLGQGRDAYDAAVEARAMLPTRSTQHSTAPMSPASPPWSTTPLWRAAPRTVAWSIRWSATALSAAWAPSSALCRRCSCCSSCCPSWRTAATWPASPSSWTACSAALACPVSRSSPCSYPRAAASPASWPPRPSRTRRTAA